MDGSTVGKISWIPASQIAAVNGATYSYAPSLELDKPVPVPGDIVTVMDYPASTVAVVVQPAAGDGAGKRKLEEGVSDEAVSKRRRGELKPIGLLVCACVDSVSLKPGIISVSGLETDFSCVQIYVCHQSV